MINNKKLLLFFLSFILFHGFGFSVFANEQTEITIAVQNGIILSEKQSDEIIPIGDLSKLVLLYLVYDALDMGIISLEDTVPISEDTYLLSQDYSINNVPLRQDVEYTVKQLMRPVIIGSANGATLALAELLAETEADYLKKVDDLFQDWGIKHYEWYNATGLDMQYPNIEASSVETMNALSGEGVASVVYHLLSKYPEILKDAQITRDTFMAGTSDAFDITNANGILNNAADFQANVNGLMLDDSQSERYNLVLSAKKEDFQIFTVLLDYRNIDDLYWDGQQIIDNTVRSFKIEKIANKGDSITQLDRISVAGAKQPFVPIHFSDDFTVVLPNEDIAPQLSYEFNKNNHYFNKKDQLIAPLDAGTKIGTISVKTKNNVDEEQSFRHLPSANGNTVIVENSEDIENANIMVKGWRNVIQIVKNIWKLIRSFFIQLFN